ncbi:MAG TPA: GGDEF domain-containing protein [Steroidobacteraceae bacterium]|jgi:diguanylate cyclase (GGDEF)-like protein|nr:GGDEF domain-containing protein [Steroidobacteraceae bacterium]
MAYGRSKMLLNGEVLPGAPPLRGVPVKTTDELREIETLRATNALLVREIAALKEREARTQRLAHRDDLTGLYNRRRMRELLDSAIAEAARHGQCVGLLFIDLNGFKSINDAYGHAAGDRILSHVATRIAGRVRTGDIVCRFGGDEFVVVLPSVPDAKAVARVADAIRERLALPYWIDDNEQHLTAAIGESMYPHDGESADVLLHRADQTMYRLKVRLTRPMINLGSTQPRHSRRRGDRSSDADGEIPGGDL